MHSIPSFSIHGAITSAEDHQLVVEAYCVTVLSERKDKDRREGRNASIIGEGFIPNEIKLVHC